MILLINIGMTDYSILLFFRITTQLDAMVVSPGSGRSSLTHITQMPDNSSTVIGGSAFDAGMCAAMEKGRTSKIMIYI